MTIDGLVPRVTDAANELLALEMPVTFSAVAARAGVARTTLYRRADLRAVVDDCRRRAQASELTLPALAVQLDQLRLGLEAVAAMVRRHEEAIRRLTSDRRPSLQPHPDTSD